MVEAAVCQVNSTETCLLISDNYHRTLKYFCALAAGIHCVKHVWIHDCCDTVCSFNIILFVIKTLVYISY